MSSTKIVDLRAEALEYMDKNKVKVLFDILGSKLAKEKPVNPNEFLQTELFKIQELKTANKPVTLFSKDDVQLLFSTFDITGRGYVTRLQYHKALEAVGLDANNAVVPNNDRIDQQEFTSTIYAELLKHSF